MIVFTFDFVVILPQTGIPLYGCKYYVSFCFLIRDRNYIVIIYLLCFLLFLFINCIVTIYHLYLFVHYSSHLYIHIYIYICGSQDRFVAKRLPQKSISAHFLFFFLTKQDFVYFKTKENYHCDNIKMN